MKDNTKKIMKSVENTLWYDNLKRHTDRIMKDVEKTLTNLKK